MKHQLTGKIVSDKMAKTVVVSVDRLKEHPKYHKRYRVTKRYKAHDEKGEYKAGDVVTIEECRPISRDKCWKVVKKIESGVIAPEIPETEIAK
jgi:small subunit ribosomal protein S17